MVTIYYIDGCYSSEELADEFEFEDMLIKKHNAMTYDMETIPGFGFEIQLPNEKDMDKVFEALSTSEYVSYGNLAMRASKHEIDVIEEFGVD